MKPGNAMVCLACSAVFDMEKADMRDAEIPEQPGQAVAMFHCPSCGSFKLDLLARPKRDAGEGLH